MSLRTAVVNGARQSGFMYASGFVGDGSLLSNVSTTDIVETDTPNQLAYYSENKKLKGSQKVFLNDDGDLVVNGEFYVNGNITTSNNTVYSNSLLTVQKGLVISETLLESHENVLTIGYSANQPDDIEPVFDKTRGPITVEVLGSLKAEGSNITNTCDVAPGTYCDSSMITGFTVNEKGRLSGVSQVPLQIDFEKVSKFGNTTSSTIEFMNPRVSLTTSGYVGISNSNPTALLSVGDGTQLTGQDIILSQGGKFYGDGLKLTNTTDVPTGLYGDSTNVPVLKVGQFGRLSEITTVPIKVDFNTVTTFGNQTINDIKVGSLETLGNVVIGKGLTIGDQGFTSHGNIVSNGFIFGDGRNLSNIVSVGKGTYGSKSRIPNIVIDDNGRIVDIKEEFLNISLHEVTSYSNVALTTLNLVNRGNALNVEGDIVVNKAKDIVWMDYAKSPICSLGQQSQEYSKNILFSSKSNENTLTFDNWKYLSIGSNVSVGGQLSSEGLFSKPGTGYILNTQQPMCLHTVFTLSKNELFNWFSFSCHEDHDPEVILPDPTVCQVGSWIGFTNLSTSHEIIIRDHYVIRAAKYPCGKSKRFLCISTLTHSQPNTLGNKWICA
jgi:hypothetical protein